ncbi:site-specific DNA-methyltransferase [Patescibacteria group bacterium]|nr:site-specific DNA-methyltransferase [Patescibacteria group bacterium]
MNKKFEEIKKKVGIPYFEDENFLLFNQDAIASLEKLTSRIFDLTVTSPPYNIGKEYEKIRGLKNYIAWSHQWIKAVYECTKPQGSFWLNLGYLDMNNKAKAIPIIYLLWEHIPFYLIQEVIWHYEAGVTAKKFLAPRNEKFLWYVKDARSYTFNLDNIRDPNVKYPNQKKNGKLRCNPFGKNPGDVWDFPKVTSGDKRSSKERTKHPAQFPIAIIDRILKASSNKGDFVLDPFIGSGTTAECALRNGRKVVGFEIKKSYCDIAIDRYKSAKDKLKKTI